MRVLYDLTKRYKVMMDIRECLKIGYFSPKNKQHILMGKSMTNTRFSGFRVYRYAPLFDHNFRSRGPFRGTQSSQ